MDKRQTIEYKFLRQNTHHAVPRMRYSFVVYLTIFQVAFVLLYGFFVSYKTEPKKGEDLVTKSYSMFMDVHSMIFIGFGFLMTFLKRYGYGSVGFNFILGAFVLQWSILVRGWLQSGLTGQSGMFALSLNSLLTADYCAAAVLVSFGAIIGKASLSQLIIMGSIEVIIQSINEFIGVNYLQAYDVGKSIYVHVFGAYFGLAVSRVLRSNDVESTKESSHYHSDLFSMIGTIFLFLYWPSFNSALAKDEGQIRAIINTYLSIISSCVATFIVSMLVSRGRLNMTHIQNATLAGGIAVGAVADMVVQPYGAMVIGLLAGVISTLGFKYVTPFISDRLHDTCGVHSLHGLPGILSGITSAVVAALASRDNYHGNRLYAYYPSLLPSSNSTDYTNYGLDETEFSRGGLARTPMLQAGYQIGALALTIGVALASGFITGYILKLPIIEQIEEQEELFDDEPHWLTPEDYSLKLTEVRVQERSEAEELTRIDQTSA